MFCLSPELPVGTHEVAISTNGIDYVYAETSLGVYAPVSISSIEPNFGSITGGEQIIIKVTNALDADRLQCRFGMKVVTGAFTSPNTILCYTPKVLT